MQLKKIYQPSEAERHAKSVQARVLLQKKFLVAKQPAKPFFQSKFRPSATRLEEIVAAGEKLPDTEVTEGKTFRKW
jgi:hypothetical protein